MDVMLLVLDGKNLGEYESHMLVWTRIFHVHLHSIGETRFFLVKMLFLEKSESPLILFYFKGKIKQEIKP